MQAFGELERGLPVEIDALLARGTTVFERLRAAHRLEDEVGVHEIRVGAVGLLVVAEAALEDVVAEVLGPGQIGAGVEHDFGDVVAARGGEGGQAHRRVVRAEAAALAPGDRRVDAAVGLDLERM